MITMDNTLKQRVYKFDNIKFLVIILVVIGHVIESYVNKSDMFKSLFLFIYTFHMPLFIFISGLFQKQFSDTNKLRINKVAYFVALGFLLKFVNTLCKYVRFKEIKINFLSSSSIEWFMFVLAMYIVTVYILRKVHPALTISISLVAACVGGYFHFINDFLFLSRYFVFLPIYLLGYYLTPETVLKISKNLAVKTASGILAVFYFVLCFRNVDFVYQLRRLFTGKNPYSTLPFECGFQHRLLCYAISAVMCIAVICFIPNIKIPILSKMGANTLSVYFWHIPLLNLIRSTDFFKIVLSLGDPLYKIVLLSFSVLLTIVLSLDIFMVPLKWLGKLIDKLRPVWCYVVIFAPFALGAVLEFDKILKYLT